MSSSGMIPGSNRKKSQMTWQPTRKEITPERESDYLYRKFGTNVNGQGDRPDREPILRVVTSVKTGDDETPKTPSGKSFKPRNAK